MAHSLLFVKIYCSSGNTAFSRHPKPLY